MKLTFIEEPDFTRDITELIEDDDYNGFQQELAKQPDKGAVIPHSGGLRKVRMAAKGRGKRGGARVIYLFLPQHYAIIFFFVYTKGDIENLSASQLKELRYAVETIKKEFKTSA